MYGGAVLHQPLVLLKLSELKELQRAGSWISTMYDKGWPGTYSSGFIQKHKYGVA